MVSVGRVKPGWIEDYVKPYMKRSLMHLSRMAYKYFMKHPGTFEFFGIDFIFDDDLNLWLLEVNPSPSMSAST